MYFFKYFIFRSLEKHNVEELNRKLVQLREREEESAKARSHDQHRYLELEAKLLSITEEKLSMQSMVGSELSFVFHYKIWNF